MTSNGRRNPDFHWQRTDKHQTIAPKILYLGTPAALVRTLNPAKPSYSQTNVICLNARLRGRRGL
jgi:hypothetical protein